MPSLLFPTPVRAGLKTLFLLSCLVAAHPSSAASEDLKLPNLGEASTSLFSAEYEYNLGRTWLRLFRSRVDTIDDPLINTYLEDLVYKLVSHSELQDRRVTTVVVNNPTMNAFAVPGGVIGVHNGLFRYARTEDELASVLAHEIAHLSQRHFSRSVEFQKRQQPLTLAGMLAGMVLLATTGSDAGMAALSATQAAAQDSALRYSRNNEQEADRIGMQTLAAADMDPYAASEMFERMLRATRYSSGDRIPEFLRTHPLSENRIADTRNRARQYPKKIRTPSLDFQLMRARVINSLATTPDEAAATFEGNLESDSLSEEANRYGLVLALTERGKTAQARVQLESLLGREPERVEYVLAQANLYLAEEKPQQAVDLLARRLRIAPENHPLVMAYAHALVENQQPHLAEEVLQRQRHVRPDDPGLWYLLAEVHGLAGNIVDLHRARAEYFILNGVLDQAEKQLQYALEMAGRNNHVHAQVAQRLQDIDRLREQMDI